jgi:hypothetical protein
MDFPVVFHVPHLKKVRGACHVMSKLTPQVVWVKSLGKHASCLMPHAKSGLPVQKGVQKKLLSSAFVLFDCMTMWETNPEKSQIYALSWQARKSPMKVSISHATHRSFPALRTKNGPRCVENLLEDLHGGVDGSFLTQIKTGCLFFPRCPTFLPFGTQAWLENPPIETCPCLMGISHLVLNWQNCSTKPPTNF